MKTKKDFAFSPGERAKYVVGDHIIDCVVTDCSWGRQDKTGYWVDYVDGEKKVSSLWVPEGSLLE